MVYSVLFTTKILGLFVRVINKNIQIFNKYRYDINKYIGKIVKLFIQEAIFTY